MELTGTEKKLLADLHLLTAKPVLYLANIDDANIHGNEFSMQVADYAKSNGAAFLALCNSIEEELTALNPEDQQLFLDDLDLAEPGLHQLIRNAYNLLGLKTFFTCGVKEVAAWTCRVDAKAPQAAAAIHTDFEKGFIRAEVIGYDDFIAHKGEQGAKDAGKWRLEGKDYTTADGDIIHFRFNV